VIDLFHYVDIDLAGATSDAARLVEYTPDRIIAITDSGGLVGAFVADWDAGLPPSGITHRVATYASNLRGELNDANVDNFTNTGLPFAAGDITAVFQYHLTIPAHGNRNLEAWIVVGFASGRCDSNAGIFCDGFENGAKTLWNEGL
jgi:hypothetical protein